MPFIEHSGTSRGSRVTVYIAELGTIYYWFLGSTAGGCRDLQRLLLRVSRRSWGPKVYKATNTLYIIEIASGWIDEYAVGVID